MNVYYQTNSMPDREEASVVTTINAFQLVLEILVVCSCQLTLVLHYDTASKQI